MKLRFRDKKREIGDIWSFFFEPLEPVEWQAGQSIRLELPRPTWGTEERRFTIASAPCEGHVQITTRVSSSEFKQNLARLKKGYELDGHNIDGDFVWNDTGRPKLFLAAGVGITPFRAMLAQSIHEQKPLEATLLYSSKDNPAVFQTELERWQQHHRDFSLVITDKRFIIEPESTLLPRWLESLIYISGPEQMVHQLGQLLVAAGLPKNQLKQDLFTGNL